VVVALFAGGGAAFGLFGSVTFVEFGFAVPEVGQTVGAAEKSSAACAAVVAAVPVAECTAGARDRAGWVVDILG